MPVTPPFDPTWLGVSAGHRSPRCGRRADERQAELGAYNTGQEAADRVGLPDVYQICRVLAGAMWLMEIAEKNAKGRILSVLEGDYDLEGLARSAVAHIAALVGA